MGRFDNIITGPDFGKRAPADPLDAPSITGLDDPPDPLLVSPGFTPSPEEDRWRRLDGAMRFAEDTDTTNYAGMLGLQQKLGGGVKPSTIEEMYPELRAAWERSNRDVRKWATDHPKQAKWVEENLARAPLTKLAEPKWYTTGAQRAYAMWQTADATATLAGFDPLALPGTPGAAMAGVRAIAGAAGNWEDFKARVSEAKDRWSQADDARWTQVEESELRGGAAFGDVLTRGVKGLAASALYAHQMVRDVNLELAKRRGDPREVARLEREAFEGKRELLDYKKQIGITQDYGSSEGFWLDVSRALASQPMTVGSMVGGGAVALVTRSPKAGQVAAKVLSFASTSVVEAGSAYEEFSQLRTDRGEAIDPVTAALGASLYGLAAAGVEVWTLGGHMNRLAPLGAAIRKGTGREWLRQSLTSPTHKRIWGALTKDVLKSAGSEGGEEVTQFTMQHLTNWLVRTAQAGSDELIAGNLQSFDKDRLIEGAGESLYLGALGGLFGPGLLIATQRGIQESYRLRASRNVGAEVGQLVKLSESDAPRLVSREFARLVELTNEENGGEPVTHAYMDPQKIKDFIAAQGEEADAVMEELLGAGGAERFRRALADREDAHGLRATFAVPVEEYLEKLGGTGFARAMMPHTTLRPGTMTSDEMVLFQGNIDSERDAFTGGTEADQEQDLGVWEEQYTTALQKQLEATGLTTDEARQNVALERAFIRTMLTRSPAAAEQVFRHAFKQVQRAAPKVEPGVMGKLKEAWEVMSPEERKRAFFLDFNTGALNLRGMEAMTRPADRGHLAVFDIEGAKFINDFHGHAALDGALRMMAGELATAGINDSGKVGGGVVAWVKDAAHASALAQQMQAAIDPRMRVTYGTAQGAGSVHSLVEAANADMSTAKANLGAAGKIGQRKGAPIVLMEGLKIAEPDKGIEGLPENDPQIKAVLERAKLATVDSAARMQTAKRLGDLEIKREDGTIDKGAALITDSHAAVLEENLRTAFDDSFFEPSGLLNETGWAMARKLSPKKFVMSGDLRAFREMNAAWGKDGTDALNAVFAEVCEALGAGRFDLAHPHGDEYFAQFDTQEEMEHFFRVVQQLTNDIVFTAQGEVDGKKVWVIQRGLSFAFGTAESFDVADRVKLPEAKAKQAKVSKPEVFYEADAYGRRSAEIAREIGASGIGRINVQRLVDLRGEETARRRAGEVFHQAVRVLSNAQRADIAQALRDLTSREAKAAAHVATVALVTTKPKSPRAGFRSRDELFRDIMSSLPEGVDSSPSEQADSQYFAWREGRGAHPGEFPGGTFDEVNKQLEREKGNGVSGLREAWDELAKLYRVRTWAEVEPVLEILRQVPGLENLRPPDDVLQYQAELKEWEERRELERDHFAAIEDEEALDDSFDVDELEQDAFHGSPHRGIKKFSLDKIGTGEGAQAYGWGLYFASMRAVADWYRNKLSSPRESQTLFNGVDAVEIQDEALRDAVFRAVQHVPWWQRRDADTGIIEHAVGKAVVEAGNQAESLLHIIDQLAEPGVSKFADEMRERHSKDLEYVLRIAAHLEAMAPSSIKIQTNQGQLYRVEVPEDDQLLDYDKPLFEQQPQVLEKLEAAGMVPPGVVAYVKAREELQGLESRLDDARERFERGEPPTAADDEVEARGNAIDAEIKSLLGMAGVDSALRESGEAVYRRISKKAGGDRAASEALRAAGIPGLRYLDGSSRSSEEGTHNYVIWDEGAISIQETFYQSGEDSKRGFIQIVKRGVGRAFRVFLTEKADYSTFAHESAHGYLVMMADIANHPEADPRLVDDFRGIMKWLGAEKFADLTTEQHERWAEAFEAYLMEGKSPSVRLAGVFAVFRLWLTRIYQTLSGIGAPLDNQIRGVFDRMLATDREIQITKDATGLNLPIYRTRAEAKMSEPEWKSYRQKLHRAHLPSVAKAQQLIFDHQRRELEALQSDEFRKAEDDAREEYRRLPEVAAWRTLRHGEAITDSGEVIKDQSIGKMDRDIFWQMFGQNHPLEEALGQQRMRRDGLHPTFVAQAAGYRSAQDMVEAVMSREDEAVFVERRARELLRERFPDLGDVQQRISKAVEDGLHGKRAQDLLLSELNDLRKRAIQSNREAWQDVIAGRGLDEMRALQKPAEAIRREAFEDVANSLAGGISPDKIAQRERSAAERALRHAAKQEWVQAALAKQDQVRWHYMWRAHREAALERDALVKRGKELSKLASRQRMGKAHPALRDVMDSLLESVGLVPRRPGPPRQGVDAMIEAMNGLAVGGAFDPSLVRELLEKPTHWRQLTVRELMELRRAVEDIRASALEMRSMLMDAQRVDREQIKLGLINEANSSEWVRHNLKLPSDPQGASFAEKVRRGGNSVDQRLLEPNEMLFWLGNKDLDSFWYRAMVRPFQVAKGREADILRDAVKPIVDTFDAMPAAVRKHFHDAFDGAAFFPDHKGTDAPARRWEILMLALNRGNASNLERLTLGRNITLQQIDRALAELTKEELAFVQLVHDRVESLWPMIRELEEQEHGMAPAKIEALPYTITTKGGDVVTMRGGYFPAVYNPEASNVGARQEAQNVAGVFNPAFSKPATHRNWTKERAVKVDAVISLNPNHLVSHLQEVAHDLAFRRPLRDAAMLVSDPRVRDAMTRNLGADSHRVFMRWLQDIGHQEVAAQKHLGPAGKFLSMLRANFSRAMLGLNYRIVAADPFVLLHAPIDNVINYRGIAKGMAEAGVEGIHLAAAKLDLLEDYDSVAQFAFDNSPVLRARRNHVADQFRRQVKSLTRGHGPVRDSWRWFVDNAWVLHDMMDATLSLVLWRGTYKQMLAELEPTMGRAAAEKRAMEHADVVVNRVLPSGHVVDMAAIRRDQSWISSMVVFYSYLSKMYQRYRNIAQPVVVAKTFGEKLSKMPKASIAAIALMMIEGPLAHLIMGHGPGEKERDRWKAWRKWLAIRTVMAAPDTVPLLGPAVELGAGLFTGDMPSVRSAPIASMFTLMGRAGMKAITEGSDPADAVFATAKALGIVTGTPVEPLKPIRYWWEFFEGKAQHKGLGGQVSGTFYGETAAPYSKETLPLLIERAAR